jgi:putative transposase
LTEAEVLKVLEVVHSERFIDASPEQIYATLLDEGRYLCSVRTIYRLLKAHGESHPRRAQRTHPVYQKPELLATAPRQLWSWDITRLKGPVKWQWFYLYVIIDVFSRYIVGWMVAERESGEFAEQLIKTTCKRQKIEADQLTLHSDRGSPMICTEVTQLLMTLGVMGSLGRPSVSDDNPYSESQFKTMKYHPTFPERFQSITQARVWCRRFIRYYNEEHKHSGLGLMTPLSVHEGRAKTLREKRQQVLKQAYALHPERFVKGTPEAPELPLAAWINPPKVAPEASEVPGREEVIQDMAIPVLLQNDITCSAGFDLAISVS